MFVNCVSLGDGVATQEKPNETEKTSPKFEICCILRFFSAFFGFLWYFFGFFGLNFDKKFQSFKNQVNNDVLGGQELPNNTFNAYKAEQMSYKSDFNQHEPLNKKGGGGCSPKKTMKKTSRYTKIGKLA